MSAPVVTDKLIEGVMDELEYLSCHYVHHLADALRILALFHPSGQTRDNAWRIHYLIAEEIFHFVPETDYQFKERHKDKA